MEMHMSTIDRRGRRMRWIAAVMITAGIGGGTLVVASRADAEHPSPPVEHVQDARLVESDRAEIPEEFLVPVADGENPDPEAGPVGWADERLIFDPAAQRAWGYCDKPIPVVDRGGVIVGFLFDDYGYVDRHRALADEFSIREERERRYGEDVRATCIPHD